MHRVTSASCVPNHGSITGSTARLLHARAPAGPGEPIPTGASSAVRAVLRGVRGRRRVQALARKDRHRVRRPSVLPAHDEPPPAAPGRALRAGDHRLQAQRRGGQLRLLAAAGHVRARTCRARRSRTSRSSRCATSGPTFHGDTLYGETEVLDKTPSRSKDDRGVVYVETRGYNQDGTVVCVFRRKVMVPDAGLRRRARRRAAGSAGAEGVNAGCGVRGSPGGRSGG